MGTMSSETNSDCVLRVGLLVNSPIVSKYDAEFVRWAAGRDDVEVTHLVIHAPVDDPRAKTTGRPNLLRRFINVIRRRGFVATLSGFLWQYVEWSERRLLLRSDETLRSHFDTEDVSASVPGKLRITPQVSASGFVYRFSQPDVSAVRGLNLDVMIRCGDGILRGELLESARFGVLSFHHADNRANRGGPPAFWEVYQRESSTGFTIQKLTNVLDGGEVFMRGHFPTQRRYLANEAQLFAKANPFMQQLVAYLAEHRKLPPALPSVPYSSRLYRRPNVLQMLRYLLRRFAFRLHRKVSFRIGYREKWHVGYCHGDWPTAEFWRGVRLPNPPGTFLADPFVIHRKNKAYCFVEQLDLNTERGVISVYELGKKEAKPLGVVIDEDFHLSFPYLFEHDGQLFMCPETAEAGEIRVYQCDEFPLRWSLREVIRPDFYAADTMLFEHDGRWWMLTNTDEAKIDELSSELNIFWSDSPLSTDWTPHAQNPVMIDSRRARNGGLLKRDGDLYRVGQEQGFGTYGEACRIYKILELTPTRYAEEEITRLSPDFADRATGGHHLHSDGKVTVFDFNAVVRS